MIAIGLVKPKTPANIGGVLRAAGCYGGDIVVIEARHPHGSVANAPTDTMKAFKTIPTSTPSGRSTSSAPRTGRWAPST